MYNCQRCGRTTEPGEKMNKVVVKTRPKAYLCGAEGREIVKAIGVCRECKDAR